jgi:uncharacterized protein YecT (DUF1311 family)
MLRAAALLLSLLCAGTAVAAPQKMTIKDVRKGYEIDVSYPRFGQPSMDRTLESWARGVAKDFADGAAEATGEPNRWSAEVTYEVLRQDAQMIVVAFTYYSYTGGAHPNASTETFNFLMPDGRRVEFAELFTPKGVQRVSDIAIARLKQDIGGPDGMSDMDWIRRGAGPNARNFSSFALLPRELLITFDAYQVAAYAAGPQEVRIPLAQLRDVMRPNPRLPQASFDCTLARSEVERAICSSEALARLDRHMSEAYAFQLVWAADAAQQQALRGQQRAWLKTRDATCRGPGIAACLNVMYQRRLKELDAP